MVLIALLFLEGLFGTLNELDFVVRVIMFSYMLFWLFMTFREAQLLFGLSSIVAGYLIFLHGVSLVLLVAFYFFFILMGSHMQMFIQFALMPSLGYQHGGDRFVNPEAEQRKMLELERKVTRGESLTFAEQEMASHMFGGQDYQSQGSAARRLM